MESAKIIVLRPSGCTKTALNYTAVDSHTRELAKGTQVMVGDKVLFCNSFKVLPNGNLMLEVIKDSFELSNFITESSSEK